MYSYKAIGKMFMLASCPVREGPTLLFFPLMFDADFRQPRPPNNELQALLDEVVASRAKHEKVPPVAASPAAAALQPLNTRSGFHDNDVHKVISGGKPAECVRHPTRSHDLLACAFCFNDRSISFLRPHSPSLLRPPADLQKSMQVIIDEARGKKSDA